AIAESSNIAQPPVIIIEVDQTFDTTILPLDKGKNKETVTVNEIITNNKKDKMNVDSLSDASENTIDITLVAFATLLL
ncbi:10292_t:CDS:1, partial [Funneliformis caledonium]